jgi:hypothetical protein
MTYTSLIVSIVCTTIIFILWQIAFRLYPAWKKAKQEEAMVSLTQCLVQLDAGAMLNGHISSGHYLHDKFYKFLLCLLDERKIMSIHLLKAIKPTPQTEEGHIAFRKEIEELDKETKALVKQAIFSVSKILLFQNPYIYLRILLKTTKTHSENKQPFVLKQKLRSGMMQPAEYLSVNVKCPDRTACTV